MKYLNQATTIVDLCFFIFFKPLSRFFFNFFTQIQIINVQKERKKTARAKTISFSLGESHHSHSANSNKNRRKIPYNPCPPSHW